jgi:hypothetical protein
MCAVLDVAIGPELLCSRVVTLLEQGVERFQQKGLVLFRDCLRHLVFLFDGVLVQSTGSSNRWSACGTPFGAPVELHAKSILEPLLEFGVFLRRIGWEEMVDHNVRR